MIISHTHKFIFIRTRKTASTSIEIALSKYCGPVDIITPLTREEEELRAQCGGRGQQNCRLPFARYRLRDWVEHLRTRRHVKTFPTHASAVEVRARVAPVIWDTYFKFAFERDPWDKAVSAYYFTRHRDGRPVSDTDLATWLYSPDAATFLEGRPSYCDGDEIIVDRVYRYEELGAAMQDIASRTGMPGVPELPRAKAGLRLDKRHYTEILTEAGMRYIERLCAWEIEHFGYKPRMRNGEGSLNQAIPLPA